jgi:flagellar M-ring protein FliF
MKQNQVSQNSSSQSPATVERNLPQETTRADDGKQSNEENQKREELTNYELSSKTVTTVSGGYGIDNLSVAVLVNRASLAASLGDKATPEAIEQQMSELEQLVASAAGAHKERGDVIKISAVDFIDAGRELEPQPPPAVAELLLRQSGNVLNAATVLIVTLLLIWFGLRPEARAIFVAPDRAVAAPAELAAHENLAGIDAEDEARPQLQNWGGQGNVSLIEDLTNVPRRSPQKRLEQIIEFDEEQAAAILKQWMHQGEHA